MFWSKRRNFETACRPACGPPHGMTEETLSVHGARTPAAPATVR